MMEEKYGNNNEPPEKGKPTGMNIVFGVIMIAIYLGMAYLLLFTPFFANLYDVVRYVMGGVFVVYGIFRGYRLFVGMK